MLHRKTAIYFETNACFATKRTHQKEHKASYSIFKPRVDDLLGGVQECLPVLLNQPLDLPPGVKTQIDLPVMQGGPVVVVDEEETENEEADKGSVRK